MPVVAQVPTPWPGAPIVADSNSHSSQSASAVFVDTSKIVTTPNTVDQHIAACLLMSTKCDASQEPPSATTISSTITISSSGVTLILGNLQAPSSGTVPLLNIAGNNNTVVCAQGWNNLLDASDYTTTGAGSAAILITGNGNTIKGCSIKGAYLTQPTTLSAFADCILIVPAALATGPVSNNVVEDNFLQYCGNRAIFAQDTNYTEIRGNYTLQSWGAGIQVNAQTFTSVNGEMIQQSSTGLTAPI